ncbi:MAG: Crp/Fnr family transcriptional regulator [Pseudomonadota bacterium]
MSNITDLSGFVRSGSLLKDLPEESLARLSEAGLSQQLPKGKTLFQKGDPGDYLAVIVSGKLKVSAYSISGTETVLNILQPGDVLGEIAAIDGGERTADVVALEACEILIIRRRDILTKIETDPEFALGISRALCKKLRDASDSLEATTLDIARRVAAALLRLAEQDSDDLDAEQSVFEIKIDQSTLARYAGLTRSNLNRVLKRFERAGASRHEKGVLTILDFEWLEEFALSED